MTPVMDQPPSNSSHSETADVEHKSSEARLAQSVNISREEHLKLVTEAESAERGIVAAKQAVVETEALIKKIEEMRMHEASRLLAQSKQDEEARVLELARIAQLARLEEQLKSAETLIQTAEAERQQSAERHQKNEQQLRAALKEEESRLNLSIAGAEVALQQFASERDSLLSKARVRVQEAEQSRRAEEDKMHQIIAVCEARMVQAQEKQHVDEQTNQAELTRIEEGFQQKIRGWNESIQQANLALSNAESAFKTEEKQFLLATQGQDAEQDKIQNELTQQLTDAQNTLSALSIQYEQQLDQAKATLAEQLNVQKQKNTQFEQAIQVAQAQLTELTIEQDDKMAIFTAMLQALQTQKQQYLNVHQEKLSAAAQALSDAEQKQQAQQMDDREKMVAFSQAQQDKIKVLAQQINISKQTLKQAEEERVSWFSRFSESARLAQVAQQQKLITLEEQIQQAHYVLGEAEVAKGKQLQNMEAEKQQVEADREQRNYKFMQELKKSQEQIALAQQHRLEREKQFFAVAKQAQSEVAEREQILEDKIRQAKSSVKTAQLARAEKEKQLTEALNLGEEARLIEESKTAQAMTEAEEIMRRALRAITQAETERVAESKRIEQSVKLVEESKQSEVVRLAEEQQLHKKMAVAKASMIDAETHIKRFENARLAEEQRLEERVQIEKKHRAKEEKRLAEKAQEAEKLQQAKEAKVAEVERLAEKARQAEARKPKPTILLVIDELKPDDLGEEVIIEAQQLIARGHAVHLACSVAEESSLKRLTGLISVTTELNLQTLVPKTLKETVHRLSSLIKQCNIEVVHSYPYTAMVPAAVAAAEHNVVFVVSLSDTESLNLVGYDPKFSMLLQKFVLPNCDRIFCASEIVQKLLFTKNPNSQHVTLQRRATLLPQSNDAADFALDLCSFDNLVVADLGDDMINGLLQFFDYAERAEMKDIVIIGDGAGKARLEDYIANTNLREQVSFMGAVPEPLSFIKQAKLVIGSGKTILGSIAYSKPTCVINEFGVKGFVDGKNFTRFALDDFRGEQVASLDYHGFSTQLDRRKPTDKNWLTPDYDAVLVWQKFANTLTDVMIDNKIIKKTLFKELKENLIKEDNIGETIAYQTPLTAFSESKEDVKLVHHQQDHLHDEPKKGNKVLQTLQGHDQQLLSEQAMKEQESGEVHKSLAWKVGKPFRALKKD